jgi:hypothetical protein
MSEVMLSALSFLTLSLVGRVDARSASGWGSFIDKNSYPHPHPLPTRGRGGTWDAP